MDYLYSRGFTLIEVLIAWAVLSSVLFSVIALETLNSQHLYHTYLQTIAVTQLDNMLDRLRANQSESFRARELNLWNTQNRLLLPSGNGNYHCDHQVCIVSLHWQERKLQFLSLSATI